MDMDNDEKTLEPESLDSTPVKKRRDGEGLVALAVLGALVGMVVGLIPVTVWTYVCKTDFFPLYALIPIAVYLFMRLFRAKHDTSSIMLLIFFSALGAYLALLSCQAAFDVISLKMSVLEIPLLTVLSIGKSGVIPLGASQLLFPVIFSALGIFASIALLSITKTASDNKEQPEGEADVDAIEANIDEDNEAEAETDVETESAVNGENL